MKKIFLLLFVLIIGLTWSLGANAEDTVVSDDIVDESVTEEETTHPDTEVTTSGTELTPPDIEIAPSDTEITADESEPPSSAPLSEPPADTYHTVFTRLWEFFNKYKAEILGVVGDAAVFVVAMIIKIRNANSNKVFAEGITETSTSQKSVVNVVNEMVDGYNAMKQSYDEYGVTENDRNRVVGAMVATNTAILEILATVYANSKNLPQGVKDIVSLKYANCLKSLENDEQMMAIVSAVRENIGAGIKVEETETDEVTETEEAQTGAEV